ncbi:hypothetical protein ACQKLP_23110 [Chitinophaga sp. NPDC101104]|uniref:hypothetical protein n=1 Tax=Chitinophaga sp. NPDC101104 TaxID=3390561 RepID=UPI003D08B3B4
MKMLTCLLPVILLLSCQSAGQNDARKQTSPEGYRLEQYERFRVRESLQEISGLVFHRDEAHFIANNDEQGKLFQVDLRATTPYPSWKFGKSGDYEETVFTGKDWFVLKSNGSMNRVDGMFSDSVSSTIAHFPHNWKREFEAAYYDRGTDRIVAICKNCEADKGQRQTSAFSFRPDSMTWSPEPVFRVPYDSIHGLKEGPAKHFRPSGAAVHPIENRVYIVASVNELLVITDLQGNVLETHRLPRKHFSQPEGITFAPNGDMYISNEGDEDHTADILKFKYHPKN